MTSEGKAMAALGALALVGFGVAAYKTRRPKSSATTTTKLPAPYSDLLVYRNRVIAVWVLAGPTITNGMEWRYAIFDAPKADVLAVLKTNADIVGPQAPAGLLTWGRSGFRESAIADAKAQIDSMDGLQPGLSLSTQGARR